jgi:hypothetical protein
LLCSALLCSALPCPALLCPSLPCPALPSHPLQLKGQCTATPQKFSYSHKRCDYQFEYRHVGWPRTVAERAWRLGGGRAALLLEEQVSTLGVQQSPGWVHYEVPACKSGQHWLHTRETCSTCKMLHNTEHQRYGRTSGVYLWSCLCHWWCRESIWDVFCSGRLALSVSNLGPKLPPPDHQFLGVVGILRAVEHAHFGRSKQH